MVFLAILNWKNYRAPATPATDYIRFMNSPMKHSAIIQGGDSTTPITVKHNTWL